MLHFSFLKSEIVEEGRLFSKLLVEFTANYFILSNSFGGPFVITFKSLVLILTESLRSEVLYLRLMSFCFSC